jgi:hypothetical protein
MQAPGEAGERGGEDEEHDEANREAGEDEDAAEADEEDGGARFEDVPENAEGAEGRGVDRAGGGAGAGDAEVGEERRAAAEA